MKHATTIVCLLLLSGCGGMSREQARKSAHELNAGRRAIAKLARLENSQPHSDTTPTVPAWPVPEKARIFPAIEQVLIREGDETRVTERDILLVQVRVLMTLANNEEMAVVISPEVAALGAVVDIRSERPIFRDQKASSSVVQRFRLASNSPDGALMQTLLKVEFAPLDGVDVYELRDAASVPKAVGVYTYGLERRGDHE